MAQPMARKMKRQGMRWLATNMTQVAMNAKRNMVLDRDSSLKFVGGPRRAMSWSCTRLKSSMLFCRSRMLRKKSFESSFTGLTVGAGASGGPVGLYWKLVETTVGAAGWRAMKEGMRRARRATKNGRMKMRYGSRQMKV